MCVKTAGQVASSVDPDQMLCSVASDFGLHCLLRPACPNIKDDYGGCQQKQYFRINRIL